MNYVQLQSINDTTFFDGDTYSYKFVVSGNLDITLGLAVKTNDPTKIGDGGIAFYKFHILTGETKKWLDNGEWVDKEPL